jgi:hypothetical protein
MRFAAVAAYVLIAGLAACRVPEPGTGAQHREAYTAANGAYPDSLLPLVPDYLPELPADADGLNFGYWRNQRENIFGYEFTYAPGFTIGITKCTYRSNTARWSCYSYV